jgi:hypothetical protein
MKTLAHINPDEARTQSQGQADSMLQQLAYRFSTPAQNAFESLLDVQFATPLFDELHKQLTSWPLVERHSFPFFLMLDDMGKDPSDATPYLVATLLAHTNTLTHLDAHTDGSESDLVTSSRGLLLDSGYSLAALYRAISLAAQLPHGQILIGECLPVSEFVAERMFVDGHQRPYSLPKRAEIGQMCQDYVASTKSRLLGCGYFEVMARAALASQGEVGDPPTLQSMRCLRMLRQVTDEIIDLTEDLDAGILTLPAMLLLEEDFEHAAPTLRDFRSSSDGSTLHALLQNSKVPFKLYGQCMDLYHQGVGLWKRRWGSSSGFTILFDIRMSYLRQEMRSTSWMADVLEDESQP